MRKIKILAIVALMLSLCANPVFAAPVVNALNGQEQTDVVKKDNKEIKKRRVESDKRQDPIKVLEGKKARVQELLREGKIKKEEADKITAEIDARIKKIQEFNSLTLQQKKDTLIKNYKTFIERRVKDGKISQQKAAELVKDYTNKVGQWDGSGYPGFFRQGHHGKCKHNESDTAKHW